ncbi:pyrroline-5-carboxylate reductase (plasmid) [Shinella sp. H4-D48]|uniref:pyrroline-5-carboxylate reductase n=1 Tax=Shinella sp. H4-D48 TaxID=2925841 RepID=UPI001F52CB0F|nr:pyrroline-5-carboxylate reductase [Shinella sp. H4-D48]UNK40680.1 pyrroline-5-carboxylate reductase [Shinella sp. H4-D48]
MSHTLLLVGCGNMGFAMLRGWLREDPMLSAYVVEPVDALRDRAAAAGAVAVSHLGDLPHDLAPDVVFVAVKPKLVETVLAGCADFAARGATFVSVAAGVTTASMAQRLPAGSSIVRCMPNTPAAIGEGMMVLYACDGVSAAAKTLVASLLTTSGVVAWIDDEAQMDAVTAISGSGPAYVFHFIEALTEAAVALGLPAQTAALLAKQTVRGAGRLAMEADADPTALRLQVTSPGGTTAAALNVFMSDERTGKLVAEATRAARDRSIELGKSN